MHDPNTVRYASDASPAAFHVTRAYSPAAVETESMIAPPIVICSPASMRVDTGRG
jgi:hypothetical protein